MTKKERDEWVKKISRRPEFKKLYKYAVDRHIKVIFLCFIKGYPTDEIVYAVSRHEVLIGDGKYTIVFNVGELSDLGIDLFLIILAHELGHIEIGFKGVACLKNKKHLSCPIEEVDATRQGVRILKKIGLSGVIERLGDDFKIFLTNPLSSGLVCLGFKKCVKKIIKNKRRIKMFLKLKKWREDFEKESDNSET